MTQFDPTTGPAETQVEDEPVLLLDLTPSMERPTERGGSISRIGLVREALPAMVSTLEADDAEMAGEKAAIPHDPDKWGGLNTFWFTWHGPGRTNAGQVGDLNSGNVKTKMAAVTTGGSDTYLMPGYVLVKEDLTHEFGTKGLSQKRVRLLVVTDGEGEDTDDFAQALERDCSANWLVEIAVLGYGTEHDRAMSAYKGVADRNRFVSVTSFENATDPEDLATRLLSLLGAS